MGGLLADSSDSSSFFLQCSRWQVGYSASLVVCAAQWSRHIVLALWPFSSSSCLEASSFPGLTSECGGSGSIGFLLSPMQIKHWVWMNCWHPVGIRLEFFFSLFKMLGTLGLMDGFFVSWSSSCSYLQLHSFLQFLNVLFLLFSHSFYCFAVLLSFWWVFYLCLPTFLRCSLWSCCWLLQRYQNTTTTLGVEVLLSRGLFVHGYWYWIGIGALLGFVVLFNSLFIMAITFLDRMFFLPATILHTFFSSSFLSALCLPTPILEKSCFGDGGKRKERQIIIVISPLGTLMTLN